MAKNILLVQDMTGYGKVALAAIMPVLSHMGHHVYTLPTAIVSNTLDYGAFEIHEMTDYMRRTLEVWKQLGFEFEAVSTGIWKCGAFLGDHAEVGCNAVCNPGTVIGRNSNIYPLSSVRGVIPADSICKTGGIIVKKEQHHG